ncbi:MAG: hypothetical protein WA021_05280 [Minisyncoccia bacterium]
MPEAWLHFAVVVSVQFLLFIAHAYYAKKISDVPRLRWQGALIGLGMGLFYDLVIGKFFGLASYELGFDAFFLVVNGTLSYGVFAANTLLMQQARLRDILAWIVVLTAVYEIVNYFFRVWTWHFHHLLAFSSLIEFLIVLLFGYFTGAIFVAALSRIFFGKHFAFLETTLKKSL